ncbi:MAG: DUF975 family protein [Christensenellales bacterium]|jgi:uncharacterized membrane protein
MIGKSKREAKAAIKGKVFEMFCIAFFMEILISAVITVVLNIIPMIITNNFQFTGIRDFIDKVFYGDIDGLPPVWLLYSSIAGFLSVFLMYPLRAGDALFHLNAAKDGSQRAADIVKPYAKTLKIGIVFTGYSILIFVGFIFLIVPGIYFALKYALLPYVLIDRPELSISETFEEAARLSKGYKGDIFFMVFSFIGWFILLPFTFMIAAIYVMPYFSTSFARLYLNIKEEKTPKSPAPSQPQPASSGQYFPYF